jgi:hypothetical protein
MKFVKYSLIAAGIMSMTSCLKSKNDFGGTREDAGTIVTAIAEQQYINTDAQNIQFGFTGTSANFAFNTPNESVKFFTLHISQPRETKVSGNMVVKVSASTDMATAMGYDPFPVANIQIADINVPATDAVAFDVPVMFTVNKAGLDPSAYYALEFTITSVSQGVISELDKTVFVLINGGNAEHNTSRITGRYIARTTVTDSAGLFVANNNTRPYILTEGRWNPFGLSGGATNFVSNVIVPTDLQIYGLGSSTAFNIYAFNRSTGASTAIVSPAYVLDASGKVINVVQRSTITSATPTPLTGLVIDNTYPNGFTYTNNNTRTFSVRYTFRATVGGVTQPFTITDTYTYDPVQVTF